MRNTTAEKVIGVSTAAWSRCTQRSWVSRLTLPALHVVPVVVHAPLGQLPRPHLQYGSFPAIEHEIPRSGTKLVQLWTMREAGKMLVRLPVALMVLPFVTKQVAQGNRTCFRHPAHLYPAVVDAGRRTMPWHLNGQGRPVPLLPHALLRLGLIC